jgi:MFS family permease
MRWRELLCIKQRSETPETNDICLSEAKDIKKVTPLPRGEIIAMALLFFIEGYNFTFVFSFIGYLIVDFGMAENYHDAGYYAGVVASSYALCQFVSGFLFGYLGDRYSKKKVILIGNIGTFITLLMFGFSTSFWFALLSRSLCGFLNANIATGKSYLSDITDGSNQTLAYSIINMTWGVAAILGPALGGILAQPATKYPQVFGGITFFEKFPYILPSLCCAVVMLFGFFTQLYFLKDRNAQHLLNQNHTQTDIEQPLEIELEAASSAELDISSPVANDEEDLKSTDTVELLSTKPTMLDKPIVTKSKALQHFATNFLNREFIVSAGAYAVVVGIDMMYEELFPLWAMLPRDNTASSGLSFSTTEIGIVQGCIGAFFCAFQLTYPIVAKYAGSHLGCIRICTIFAVMMVATPQISLAAGQSEVLVWVILIFYTIIRALFQVFGYTSVMIMINNSAYPGMNGVVNGAGNSVGCIAKIIGPIIAGPMLAWASKSGYYFPLNTNLPFTVCALFSITSLLTTFFVPSSINEPRGDKNVVVGGH